MAKTHKIKEKVYDEVEKALYVITYCGERYPSTPAEDSTGMAMPEVCQECADARAKAKEDEG